MYIVARLAQLVARAVDTASWIQPLLNIAKEVAAAIVVLFIELAKILAPPMLVVGVIGTFMAPGTQKYRFEGLAISAFIILVLVYFVLPFYGY